MKPTARGHKVIDPAELDRVYGLVKMPEHERKRWKRLWKQNWKQSESFGDFWKAKLETIGKSSETTGNGDESTFDVAFLHSEVARLESELETAGKREATLEARTDKLIEMLAIEQEQTRLLMLPKPQLEPEQKPKKRGSWLGYFRMKR